jgi:hypothetical protein
MSVQSAFSSFAQHDEFQMVEIGQSVGEIGDGAPFVYKFPCKKLHKNICVCIVLYCMSTYDCMYFYV